MIKKLLVVEDVECGEFNCDKCIYLSARPKATHYCTLFDVTLEGSSSRRCEQCLSAEHRFDEETFDEN
jgi:hypothetical protein